ncbi:MAG: hypothetical protein HY847_13020 [Betaproteobacteria bacterium]|nr:hypothetical protein [Betaproteobacteria bacterium]
MNRTKLILLWLACQVATLGGDEDETISSRCWRYREEPYYAIWVKRINWLFDDPDHCRDAFENEKVKRERYRLNSPPSEACGQG